MNDMDEPETKELSETVARYEQAIEPVWTEPLMEVARERLPNVTGGMCLIAEARCGKVVREVTAKLDDSVRCVVVEPTRELLDRARDRLADADKQIFFASERVFSMSYADGVVDAAVCLEGLQTLTHVKRALEELSRVCSEGSSMVVAATLDESLPEMRDLLFEAMTFHEIDSPQRRLDQLTDRFASTERVVGLADTRGFAQLEAEKVSWQLEFESGAEFLQAPLIQDVWLPQWMGVLPAQAREPVIEQVEQSIDTYWSDRPFETQLTVALLEGIRVPNSA